METTFINRELIERVWAEQEQELMGRTLVALHEAGHAVTTLDAGYGVSLIQLWVDHSGIRLGRCHVDLISDPMTMAVTRMAGPAVEALIEARGFIPEAIQQLEERYEYAMYDHAAGEEIETDFVNAGPLALECLPGLMDKLESLWPALEAIAIALLEEGSMVTAGFDANILSGERIQEIYKATV